MNSVVYLSDFPYSIGFGGKEIQLGAYCDTYLAGSHYCGERLDYWNRDGLRHCKILHLFGYSGWYRSLLRNLRNKHPNIRIASSPNFYRAHSLLYHVGASLFRRLPVRNYFSEIYEYFQLADLVIVNSQEEKRQLETIYAPKAPVTVIKNGIEDDFALIGDDVSTDRVIPYPYVLSVGFYDERKNTARLLRAFCQSLAFHSFHLVLVGEPRFSSSRQRSIFEHVKQIAGDRIHDLGYIDRRSSLMKRIYRDCEFHILPSILETPGLSNLEALSFGKQIVVGDCGPVREYFGPLATYCDPRSVNDIAMRIQDLALTRKEGVTLPKELTYSHLGAQLVAAYDRLLR